MSAYSAGAATSAAARARITQLRMAFVRPPTPDRSPPEELAAVFGSDLERVDSEPLGRGVPAATAGVWLVRAGDDSAVLKLVHEDSAGHERWPAAPDPEHPYYWRREPCVYESRLIERVPAVRAPRLRGLFERRDGSVALWLEALREPVRSIEGYGRAARSLRSEERRGGDGGEM